MEKTFGELKSDGKIENIIKGSEPDKGEYISYEKKQYNTDTGEELTNAYYIKPKSDLELEKEELQKKLDNVNDQLKEFGGSK